MDWPSLWRTPDQQGEELLRQGDAAAASRIFSDPRRKAYALLQSGDYARAARDLAAFDDSDSAYNRGNALAHNGDLAGALQAYDTALARNPYNRDAQHNRDLVTQAMKHAPKQPGEQKPGRNSGSQSGNSSGGKGTGGNEASRPSEQNSSRSGQSGEQSSNPSGKTQASAEQAGKQGGRQSHRAQPQGESQVKPDQSGPSGQNQVGQHDHAAEARRDADQALHTTGAGARPAEGRDERLNEQQLAQEQWLRQIPDDPGGLLRRKFLIEHMQRQQ